MEIRSGKLYENRTWRFLYPSLKAYEAELVTKLSGLLKLAVGVGDYNREDKKPCLCILIDTNIPMITEAQRLGYKKTVSKFLDWVSYKEYYVEDYMYEENMHMVVLKLPEKHHKDFLHFVKGEYSKMYTLLERREYFKFVSMSNKDIQLTQNNKLTETKQILEKDSARLPTFVAEVNKRFKTDVNEVYFREAELDYPPVKKEEIFNYK